MNTTICKLLLAAMLAIPASAQIDVTAYGAKPDAVTDNAPFIQAALEDARSHPGSRVYFPCRSGNTYLIKSPVVFASATTIEGDGPACQILYSGANPQAESAFSFVAAHDVTLRRIGLYTSPTNPPKTILLQGGVPGTAGSHLIENVAIVGYATVALTYAVTAECSAWHDNYIEYDGGGASAIFYTSGSDDFHVCSGCENGSNLTLDFSRNRIVDRSPDSLAAVASQLGGGTGDQYFHDNRIVLGQGGTKYGFELVSGNGVTAGPNSQIRITTNSVENGKAALHFRHSVDTAIYNLHVEDVSWSSSDPQGSGFFAFGDDSLVLHKFRMVHNEAQANGGSGSTSVYAFQDSEIDENYGLIVVRYGAYRTSFWLLGDANASLPSSNVSSVSIFNSGVWTYR